MLLKLSWYEFELEYYNLRMLTVVLMVTTKKIAIEHTQKEMGRIKMFCYKKTSTLHKKRYQCRK